MTAQLTLDQYGQGFAARWDELVDWQRRLEVEGAFLNRVVAGTSAGRELLDIACGTGFHAAHFARSGYRVDAADGSAEMVERARANLIDLGGGIRIEQMSWQALRPLSAHRYDAVICLGSSMPHASAEQRRALLRRIHGLLAVGGVLLVDHRNFDYIVDHQQMPPGRSVYAGKVAVSLEASDQAEHDLRLPLSRRLLPDPDRRVVALRPATRGVTRGGLRPGRVVRRSAAGRLGRRLRLLPAPCRPHRIRGSGPRSRGDCPAMTERVGTPVQRWLAVLLIALFVGVTYGFGIYVFSQLLPTMSDDLGFSYATAGRITGIGQFAFIVFAFAATWLSRRFNGAVVVIGSAALCTLCLVGVGLTSSTVVLTACLAIAAGTSASVYVPIVEIVPRLIEENRRGTALGIISSGTTYGVFISAAIIPILTHTIGWRAVWFAVAAISLVLIAFAYRLFARLGLFSEVADRAPTGQPRASGPHWPPRSRFSASG